MQSVAKSGNAQGVLGFPKFLSSSNFFHQLSRFFRPVTLSAAGLGFVLSANASATSIGTEGGLIAPRETVQASSSKAADPQYRQLFLSWKRMDAIQQGVVSVPSRKPVSDSSFTSGFGVRSDPFRGGAAMHAGVDLAGPVGTPVYATADGVVGRAQWASGYGNLVQIEHGKGLQTRYGHLSKIVAKPNTRVKRGDLIGLMGSTGRSTGSHLHYEVRLDGRAMNPIPFLESAEYLVSVQRRAAATRLAMGGPEN